MSSAETDVLVVGAGIQGCGVAQAAAVAGLSVTIVERAGVAAGTSSRSSKLIHGGLRYLESRQFGLVRESLRERATLLRIAPHLVRLVPFHIPVYRSTSRGPLTIRAGLSLYALLGGLGRDTRFSKVPRREWDALDGLATDGLRAVYRYRDGQTDDAALCRAVLRSARELGAEERIGVEVLSGERDSSGWTVQLREGEAVHSLHARFVVNAAGPWANHVLDHFSPSPARLWIDHVGGTHIELEGALERGIYYAEAADGRAVFTMPWRDHTLVGTTEEPFSGDPARVAPTEHEIAYLEETFSRYFPERPVRRIDAWSGLRVLPKGEGRAFDRPREVILIPDDRARPTLVTIYGGKLTGYRHTAERVSRILFRALDVHGPTASTADLRLPE